VHGRQQPALQTIDIRACPERGELLVVDVESSAAEQRQHALVHAFDATFDERV
jgi:hypothetical protein